MNQKIVQLNVQISQGSAAADLRGEGGFYSSFFVSSYQKARVKELFRSGHVCQSCHEKTAWVFFDSRCILYGCSVTNEWMWIDEWCVLLQTASIPVPSEVYFQLVMLAACVVARNRFLLITFSTYFGLFIGFSALDGFLSVSVFPFYFSIVFLFSCFLVPDSHHSNYLTVFR